MSNPAVQGRGRAPVVIPAGLSLSGVGRRYGDKHAVRDVTFTIEPSEVLCLLGPSGCGKSTLLRLIAGIEDLSSGRIAMDGRDISWPGGGVPPEDRGIGMVFQDYALFPHMTALDNIRFGLDRLPRAEQIAIARHALQRIGLSDLENSYPDMLSGGEQQRVALARAMVPRPRMILMDEPFSNLDKRMRDLVRADAVSLLREAGVTTLIVTHDPEEAMRIADRIVLMRAGQVVQIGPAGDLYSHPADLHTARFFCEINELSGVVKNGAVATALGSFPAGDLAEGTLASICIRPVGVGLHPPGQGVPARVLQRRFNMQVDLFELAVQGLEAPVLARIRHAPPFQRGDDVSIIVEASEVLVFPGSTP